MVIVSVCVGLARLLVFSMVVVICRVWVCRLVGVLVWFCSIVSMLCVFSVGLILWLIGLWLLLSSMCN